MRALTLSTSDHNAKLTEIPNPIPAPEELLVRVQAIALNPVDALYTAHPLGATGRVVGSDFAGIVVAQGARVPASCPQVGDRVAGFLQGACSVNERPGAFAEFLVVPADLVWKVPVSLSLPHAASISLCALTAAQALFLRLGIPAPFGWTGSNSAGDVVVQEDILGDEVAFIYGASTSVGLYAAQLIHRAREASGRPIRLVGAASKARHALLSDKPYSYDSLVDYRDQDWPEQVRQLCKGKGVKYAFDCISEGTSVARTASTLGSDGVLAVVRSREGGAWEQENVQVDAKYGAVWEGLGVEVEYQGFTVKASAEAREFTVAFYEYLSTIDVNENVIIEPNPIRLMPGGLERVVPDGFTLLGAGSMEERDRTRTETWMAPISAEKVVYNLI